MAESTAVSANPVTPTSALASTTSLPNSSSPVVSSSNTSAATGVDQFLKPTSPRKRRRSPENLSATLTAEQSSTIQTSAPRTFIFDSLPKTSERPLLTAAAELADQRRRKEQVAKEQGQQQSPNKQKKVLGELMGQENNMSKPEDAPKAAPNLTEATIVVPPTISIPEETQGDSSLQTSPVSMSSLTTMDSNGAATVTAAVVQVASPGQMGDEPGGPEERESRNDGNLQTEKDDGLSNKALTFPGPLLSAQVADPRRGMSLPHSGFSRDESRSPSGSSAKKHKCPYCSTDFTRHHNLKSHLLTHSHEKPYMCQTCDSRFRRLHDLKRHTKLHTGERPHVCPKCKRSFARGDALARHNKGQGGCAGRRSSVGSYGGDGPFDGSSQGGQGGEEGMDGLIYTGEASHEPENMDDDPEDDRRKSLPSIRRQEVSLDSHYQQTHDNYQSHQSRQPSTYPPVATRQSTTIGGLYPPSASHGGNSSTSTSPGQTANMGQYPPGTSGSSTYQAGGSNVFAQGGMTESPKPLSPAGLTPHQHGHADSTIHRNRSPSLTQQFQQQQYGRRMHGRGISPPIGLPPPTTSSANSNPTHLPSLPSLNPPDSRYTLHSQSGGAPSLGPPISQGSLPAPPYPSGGATPSSYHSQQGTLSSHSNSHSSHSTQAHGSGERGNASFPPTEDRLWAYVKSLEQYVRTLEQKTDKLQEEVHSLRGQINGSSHR